MIALGVTGGIGMGKSTLGEILSSFGTPVVDSDRIATDLIQPGETCLAQILDIFGDSYRSADGGLDRKKLATLVFQDAAARQKLESIIHPQVRKRWQGWLKLKETEGHQIAAVLIPLLFETHAEQEFDAVVCVACSLSIQQERLKNRGWSETEIKGRMAAQLSVEEKMLRSQFVVWSDGDWENYAVQIGFLLNTITTL